MYITIMDMFTALAEPTRRNIVELLATSGQLSATQIYHRFPVSAPAISQHLKVLRDLHVVSVEKNAQRRLYRIDPASVAKLEVWIAKLKKHWEHRFEALDSVLSEESAHIRT